ncbi:MAG TPA: hypothetical protein VK338_06715 [Candidatus Nitrosocosmicus sp.]|nr:hypothetical protein [Candidatus Nitrosocosmicus sp.]
MVKKNTSNELSYDTKTIIVVLTLIFVYPIGLILMYAWMKWPGILKFAVMIPIYIMILALVLSLSASSSKYNFINSSDKDQCTKACEVSSNGNECVKECLNRLHPTYGELIK